MKIDYDANVLEFANDSISFAISFSITYHYIYDTISFAILFYTISLATSLYIILEFANNTHLSDAQKFYYVK